MQTAIKAPVKAILKPYPTEVYPQVDSACLLALTIADLLSFYPDGFVVDPEGVVKPVLKAGSTSKEVTMSKTEQNKLQPGQHFTYLVVKEYV